MKREIRVGSSALQGLERNLKRAKERDVYDYMVKIIIVGDSGVGKTNIISRFCAKDDEEVFKDYHVATIGVDFSTKIVQLPNARLKMQIWDTAGQERFKTITETYYKGAAGIIMVYAVDSQETFLNIEHWVEQVNMRATESVRKVLVANKIDVEDECGEDSCQDQPRKISKERGLALAERYGMEYYEVSAKSNEGIAEMFKDLAAEIDESVRKATVKNEAEDVELTLTLDSKHARSIRKVRKMGIQYKVEEQSSLLSKWRDRLCGC